MESITAINFNRAEFWLLFTTLIYFLMNGAQLMETLVFVPKWTNNPPLSFSYLTDKNGIDLKTFWIILHSLHEITFILAIYYCWKMPEIKNTLIVLFFLHLGVRVWTLSYFAPHIIAFQKIEITSTFDENLLKRTSLWKTLNYVRVAIFLLISIGLIPLLLKLIHLKPK